MSVPYFRATKAQASFEVSSFVLEPIAVVVKDTHRMGRIPRTASPLACELRRHPDLDSDTDNPGPFS